MATKQIPSLIQKKIIPAPRADVFDAWTRPDIMKQWFFPAEKWSGASKIDLRVGGQWSHEMIDDEGSEAHNGQRNKPGTRFRHFGEYLEITPPARLVFTWNSPFVENTRVTIELRDLGNSTELTLTHEFLPNDEMFQSHTQGWTGCLGNLGNHFNR